MCLTSVAHLLRFRTRFDDDDKACQRLPFAPCRTILQRTPQETRVRGGGAWHAPDQNGRVGRFPMANNQNIRVAIVGLGFGAEFIPIYQNYPGAEMAAICRRSRKDLDEC